MHGFDTPREGFSTNTKYDDDDRPEQDVREYSVRHMMQQLDIECERFGKMASVLEDKLRTVLVPEEPSPENVSPGRDEPLTSPWADELRAKVTSLRTTGARIERLMRRVDL